MSWSLRVYLKNIMYKYTMRFFIIPFRGREEQREVFLNHMNVILKGTQPYMFIFVHQKDKRTFNRGAMKNIGFLYVREKFPEIYKKSTFIFHDIDFVPYKRGLFSYDTRSGVVNHFFGFKFALGGIFAIKGADFEKIKGFPNYWGWGYEDNKFQKNWRTSGGKINYNEFISIRDKQVISFDTYNFTRTYNRKNPGYNKYNNKSNFSTIQNLQYGENDFRLSSKIIDVVHFETEEKEEKQVYVKNTIPPQKQRPRKLSFMSEIFNH